MALLWEDCSGSRRQESMEKSDSLILVYTLPTTSPHLNQSIDMYLYSKVYSNTQLPFANLLIRYGTEIKRTGTDVSAFRSTRGTSQQLSLSRNPVWKEKYHKPRTIQFNSPKLIDRLFTWKNTQKEKHLSDRESPTSPGCPTIEVQVILLSNLLLGAHSPKPFPSPIV